MERILSLNGKINKDANAMYIDSDKGEVFERRNARIMSVDGGEMLINVSLKGMQSIGTTTGLGTVVGFTEDKKRNWGIYFIKGTVFCSIYAYQADTDTVIKIVDDSASPFFNFGSLVSAKMVDDIMVWTDGNQIRYLDVVKCLAFTNGSGENWKDAYYGITDLNTRLAIPTPTDEITAVWGYDSARLSNNLANKTWQFAIQYKYKGGEKSAFSGYSPLYIHPGLLIYPSTSDAIKSENYLRMNVPLGGTEVVSALLMARENQGLWFLAKEFKKLEPTDTVSPSYDFYDNTVREYVSADIAVIPNQGVPLKCGKIETAKNRLILGDVTTNYDHPSVNLSLSRITKSISKNTITNDNLSTVAVITPSKKLVISSSGLTVVADDVVYLGFDGMANMRIQWVGSGNDFSAKYSFLFGGSYQCTSSSIDDILTYFTDRINDASSTLINHGASDLIYAVDVYDNPGTSASTHCISMVATKVGSTIEITFVMVAYYSSIAQIYSFTDLKIDNEYGYSRKLTIPIESNTFLGGSGYNVAVEYYDEIGNTSGAESETGISIPMETEIFDSTVSYYRLNKIGVSISGIPPTWATKYRFLCSKSTSFASVLSFVPTRIELKTAPYGTIQSYIIEQNGVLVMAISMPNTFNYTYVKGDYINIKWRDRSSSGLNLETGIEVVGTAASVTTFEGGVISGNFIIAKTTTHALLSGAAMVTIYRPLKESSEYVYFHASPLFDISVGTHSVLSTELISGDGWMVKDDFGGGSSLTRITYNPFYVETTELKGIVANVNVGKPTVSLKDFKQEKLQEIWYGGQLIDNTGINELRDFSNIGRLAMSESDGIITGLVMAGDVLKVIQDNKETSVYIGKEQVTNADGTMQLIASQGFLGTINRSVSSYGSQHPQSIVTNERDVYYFDVDNACVVRTSPNGQFPISSYGLTSYFKEKSQQIRNSIVNSLTHKIISYYDRRHNEYVIIFDVPTKQGLVITNHREAVVFNEASNYWVMSLDLTKAGKIPNMVGMVGQTALSFTDSTLWLHERTDNYNTFYNEVKPINIVGIANVSPITEKCLKSLSMDANIGFETTITTPITTNNLIGQETVLLSNSYMIREGKYVSPVYQNIRTTAGNDLNHLYDGDDMQGKYFTISLTQTSSSKLELRNMGVNILSE